MLFLRRNPQPHRRTPPPLPADSRDAPMAEARGHGAGLFACAGAAAAYTVQSPAFLTKSTMNGAETVLNGRVYKPGAEEYDNLRSGHGSTSHYTLEDVPSGVTLSVSNVAIRASTRSAIIVTLPP